MEQKFTILKLRKKMVKNSLEIYIIRDNSKDGEKENRGVDLNSVAISQRYLSLLDIDPP